MQKLLSAFGAGDQDTVLGLLDPAIELVPLVVRAGLVPEAYRGIDGVRAYFQDPRAASVERSFVVTRLRSTRDTVVAFGHLLPDGAGLPAPAVWVWRLREGLVTHGDLVSDASVLGAERFMPGDGRSSLWLELPAAPECIAEARHAVRVWAENLTPTEAERDAITLAVSEAATNVVRHAYPGNGAHATFRIRADVEDGQVHVRLEDDGVGLGAISTDPGLGVGIPLLGRLASGVTLVSAPERAAGCEVRMWFPLDSLAPRGSP
ncbi:MAG: ATP-binding protein [Actinomycetota bacterium]|nr:ATP-binding protein [Actinomycetota bacterium]